MGVTLTEILWRWWQQVRIGWQSLWGKDFPREETDSSEGSSFHSVIPHPPRLTNATLIRFPVISEDGQLPSRVYRQLIQRMQGHIRNPCPNCHTQQWLIWPKFGLIEVDGVTTTDRIPVVLTICEGCGWTSWYVLNRVDPTLKAYWYGEEVPPDESE